VVKNVQRGQKGRRLAQAKKRKFQNRKGKVEVAKKTSNIGECRKPEGVKK